MTMLRRKIKTNLTPALSERDLMLAIHGPWHEGADCETRLGPTVLWHPRVQSDHLRALWAKHQATIEAAAAEAGVDKPWITDRLWFIDILEA